MKNLAQNFQLRRRHGFVSPHRFQLYVAQAFKDYEALYKTAVAATHADMPEFKDPDYSTAKDSEEFKKLRLTHEAAADNFNVAVRRRVHTLINFAPPKLQRAYLCALDPEVRDWWKYQVPRKWVACMEYGGNTDLGIHRRSEAMDALKRLHDEAVIFYVDDVRGFLMFRVPGNKPLGV